MSDTHKITYPSTAVLKALMREKITTKDKLAKIAGEHGERIRHHVENSNLNKWAFGVSAKLFATFNKDELKALADLGHLKAYIEVVEAEFSQKGHVGNLADMAQKVDAKDAVAGVKEPDGASNVTPIAALKERRAGRPKKVKAESAPADLDSDTSEPAKEADGASAGVDETPALPPMPPEPTYALN